MHKNSIPEDQKTAVAAALLRSWGLTGGSPLEAAAHAARNPPPPQPPASPPPTSDRTTALLEATSPDACAQREKEANDREALAELQQQGRMLARMGAAINDLAQKKKKKKK